MITSLFLKDNLTIELGEGAELLGDTKRENFGILPGLIDNDKNEEYYLITSSSISPIPSLEAAETGIGSPIPRL